MRKFDKAYNLVLIFTLIGMFLCPDLTYATPSSDKTLRLQIGEGDDTYPRLKKTIEGDSSKSDDKKPGIEIINAGKTIGGYIVIAKVEGEEYEISSIGVKRYKEDLTSEEISDSKKCIKIANMVNEVDGRLAEAALEEKWSWWPAESLSQKAPAETEDAIEIADRMVQSISKLRELWDQYPPEGIEKNKPLFVAEQILAFYFRDDKVTNKLNIVTAGLQLYEDSKRQGKPYNLEVALIERNIKVCEEIVARFENTRIKRLQDDEEIKSDYIEYTLEHPNLNMGVITKEGVASLDNLSPEEIRAIIARYVNDLKPVIQGLRQDLDKLKAIVVDKLPGVSPLSDTLKKGKKDQGIESGV